jgi:hypothetical protein
MARSCEDVKMTNRPCAYDLQSLQECIDATQIHLNAIRIAQKRIATFSPGISENLIDVSQGLEITLSKLTIIHNRLSNVED